MSEKIIILVADNEEGKHGEISVLDDPRKAERLVETLLEAGFERDRIRVFTGSASEFQVSQRPVVALMEDGEAQPAVAETRRVVAEEAAPRVEARKPRSQQAPTDARDEAAVEVTAKAEGGGEPEQPDSEGEPVEVAAEAEAKEPTPVKFSSLFRSA